jgi:hypothetical protein
MLITINSRQAGLIATNLLGLQVFHSHIDANLKQELDQTINNIRVVTERQRNHFIVTVIMFALFKARNNTAQLVNLPIEMLVCMGSYLSFPSIKLNQHHRHF